MRDFRPRIDRLRLSREVPALEALTLLEDMMYEIEYLRRWKALMGANFPEKSKEMDRELANRLGHVKA
jgi:hypothetical protein